VAVAVEDDEGLVDQVGEETQDFPVLERRAGADPFGRAKREPPGEGGQPTEQDPLRVGEEVMTPLHRRLERLLPGEGSTGAAGEQAEAITQAIEDTLRAQGPDPSGGQFDGQRDTVQANADGGDGRGVATVDPEGGT